MISLIFLALLGFTAAAEMTCYKGWERGNNRCYEVVNNPTDWMNAWMYCGAMGTELAEIGSQEEEDIVTEILEKYKKLYPHFWIDFVSDEPVRPARSCVHINATTHSHVFDYICDDAINFICETTPGRHERQVSSLLQH